MEHLLIIGAGSVGKRHLRNFAQLGCAVSAMDPRADRLEEAGAEVTLQGAYTDLDAALQHPGITGVVICSPPRFHMTQSIASLERRLPVLLEKPVSPTADEAERVRAAVERSGTPLLLGYTYRWWPPLRDLRTRMLNGEVGKLLHVRFVMSAHLADWHPWEAYQEFFMASKELGGGALLDESHFIDLMLWFFGMPLDAFARVEKLSDLQIDTDDNVDAVFTYPDGLRVSMHLDLYGRPHEKYISVVGEAGTLHWSFDPNRVRVSNTAGQTWQDVTYDYERNDMFVNVAREFLSILNGSTAPSCTIDDGCSVMQIIEAMRASSESGRMVSLEKRAFLPVGAS